MTTDDESETDERSMSRRSVLSGAGLVAGGWLANKLTGGAVSVSKAQQSQEYRIEIAPDDVTEWAIDDEMQGDGTVDLIIKHVPSDTTVRWDRSAGEWDFSQVSSFVVNALTADSATVTNELDAGSVSTDVLDTAWAIDAGGYSDLQSALNDADSVGIKHIIIPPGTYGTINPYAGQVLTGQGSALNSDVVIDGGSRAAVDDVNMPTNFIIQNCELRNDTGGGEAASVMDPDGVKFIDCYISQAAEEGLDLRGSHIQVTGCDFADGANITNESVLLRSSCENCTVRNNTRTGTINDSGTGNDVGGNT